MRMKEITARSGLPASTVRYYLAQGLLPNPERPTRNSAIYDQRHLDALHALKTIKSQAPELPLAQLARVMELVRLGVEADVALALHRAVGGGVESTGCFSLEELARKADVSPQFVEQLVDLNIIVSIPGQAGFDVADLETLKAFVLLEGMAPGEIGTVAEIAALLRQASALEMELRNRISAEHDVNGAAAISKQMQEWANFWHSYLFARYRLADIRKHGLGPAEFGDSSEGTSAS